MANDYDDKIAVLTKASERLEQSSKELAALSAEINGCIQAIKEEIDRATGPENQQRHTNGLHESDIGPLWAKHFSKIDSDVGSNTIVFALAYIIEDKAKASAIDGD